MISSGVLHFSPSSSRASTFSVPTGAQIIGVYHDPPSEIALVLVGDWDNDFARESRTFYAALKYERTYDLNIENAFKEQRVRPIGLVVSDDRLTVYSVFEIIEPGEPVAARALTDSFTSERRIVL